MFQLIAVKEITSSAFVPPARPGDVVVTRTLEAARHLIENGLCEWPKLDEKPRAPSEPLLLMRRPPGWPVDRFAVVNRAWEGETAVLIGGGPSVTSAAVDRCKGLARAIAINNSYLLAPWADVCYFADARWWEWHRHRPEFRSFAGQKVSIENTGMLVADPAVFILHNDTRETGDGGGLSERPNALRTGSNSGYQAINLAVLGGAKRIILLGFDMKFGPGKKSHWHQGHPIPMPESSYKEFARNFASMAPQLAKLGVKVYNATPGSLITAFERAALESLLPRPS